MRAFIVGLGSIGRRHGRNLRALSVEIVGFDPQPERRAQFAEEVSESITVATFDDGLANACEFAVIASPNRFHLEQALVCARAGLHLFIEKPLATALDGVEALQRAVAEGGLVVMMGSNWKFHPGPSRLRALVAGGALGRILALQAIGGQYLPDWHPWEDYRLSYSARRDLGGGVLLDSHDVDMLSWLVGPVECVACRTMTSGSLEIDTADLACLWLAFRNGALGSLQIDYLQRPYARRVHVTGTDGTAIWDHVEGRVRHYDAGQARWTETAIPADYDLNDMYVDEMRHFLGCITSGSETATPLPQAAHVLAVLDGARRSSEANGSPVHIA